MLKAMAAIKEWIRKLVRELAYEPDGTACPVRIPTFVLLGLATYKFMQIPHVGPDELLSFAKTVGLFMAIVIGKVFTESDWGKRP